MGSFGFNEWIVIVIIILILVRPHDLPNIFYQFGQLYGKVLRMYYAIIDEFNVIYESTHKIKDDIKLPPNSVSQAQAEQNQKNLLE